MPIANFTPVTSIYEYRVQEWQNDLSGVQAQWNEDDALLSSYKEQKSETVQIGMMIKSQILGAINELQRGRDDLEKELEEFAGVVWDEFASHSSRTAEDVFNDIFDPFLQALTPLMDVVGSVGLPEVPIIGNLQTLIQKIAKTGQLISRLPKTMRDAAKKEADEQRELEKKRIAAETEFADAERKYKQVDKNMTWWDRQMDDFKNSPFGKILLEIVEIFKQVIQVVIMICQCAVYAALLMLLEKLKPLLQQLGDIIALISNALSVMKMLMLSSAQMVRFFYKMLEEKLSDLWNVVRYVIAGGWSLPVNGMISAIHADMICCEFEMSSINMEIGKLSLDHTIDLDSKDIRYLKDYVSNLDGQIDEAKNEDPRDSEEIEDLETFKKDLNSVIAYSEAKKKNHEAALEEHIANMDAFSATAPGKYKVELEKRASEDKFLQESHKQIAAINEKNKELTKAAKANAEKTRKDMEELKKRKEQERKEKEALELERRRAEGLPT